MADIFVHNSFKKNTAAAAGLTMSLVASTQKEIAGPIGK